MRRILVALSAGWVLSWPGQLPAQTSTSPDSAVVAQGRAIFQGKGLCFSCHGKNGDGVLGPTTQLAGRRWTHVKPELAALIQLIKTGVDSAHSSSGKVMPPRGGSRITDDEIAAVARYVLTLQSGKPAIDP